MQKIKEHVVYYYFSYLLSLTSMAYGWKLIVHPEILQIYMVYQRAIDMFDHRFIGVLLLILGASYMIAVIFDLKKFKQILLPSFSFIWTFFSFSFILSAPPNTVGILTLSVALIGFGVSLRGDF